MFCTSLSNQFNIMSKNFKSNLKLWLDKLFKHENCTKKYLIDIAKTLTLLDFKESKASAEIVIANHLSAKLQQMKSRQLPYEDGQAIIQEFLHQNKLTASSKLITILDQIVQKYFTSNQIDKRNYQDFICNIWNQETHSYDCLCPKVMKEQDTHQQEEQEKCYNCGRYCHPGCFWERETKGELYECPLCYLTQCLPNKKVVKILFAGYLRQNKKDKIQYKINLPLQILPEQYLIQARCTRFSRETKYELAWPQNCMLLLNGKKINQYRPLPLNSPFKRRIDQEIQLDRRSLSVMNNSLIIEQKHQFIQNAKPFSIDNHFIVVVAVKMLGHQQMHEQIMRNRISQSQSKQRLRQYLDRGIQDCFIDRIKVSLKCQYYKSTISVPIRSKHCIGHYQPLDLKGFIMANILCKNNSQRWKCPVCKKRAYDLAVDEYLYKFIKGNHHLSQISFNSQGEAELIQDPEGDKDDSVNFGTSRVDGRQYGDDCGNKRDEERRNGKMDNRAEVIQIDQFNNKNCDFEECIELDDSSERDLNQEAFKRTFGSREIQISIQDSSEKDQLVKKKKIELSLSKEKKKEKEGPLSFLYQKGIGDKSKENDIFMESEEELRIRESLSSEEPIPQKPKYKKRQKKVIREEIWCKKQGALQKMKTLVPSPAIRTVIPEAIRIIQSKLPLPKKNPIQNLVIDIESDDQSTDALLFKKLQHHRAELNKQKNLFIIRNDRQQLTSNDECIFLALAEKFMSGSNGGKL